MNIGGKDETDIINAMNTGASQGGDCHHQCYEHWCQCHVIINAMNIDAKEETRLSSSMLFGDCHVIINAMSIGAKEETVIIIAIWRLLCHHQCYEHWSQGGDCHLIINAMNNLSLSHTHIHTHTLADTCSFFFLALPEFDGFVPWPAQHFEETKQVWPPNRPHFFSVAGPVHLSSSVLYR